VTCGLRNATALAVAFLFATAASAADPNACAACHGEGGNSTNPAVPSLAGQPAQFISTALYMFRAGQRKDAQGQTIPRKILNKFTCTVAGKQVFAADFEPAVSANPYIQFKFKATESGPVVLTWVDDDGSKIVGEEKITVT